MRQRRAKNMEERMERLGCFMVENPQQQKGNWRSLFGNENPLYLEIGCGKGQFILEHSKARPQCNFIAIEGQESVILRALEKAEKEAIENVKFLCLFVHDIGDLFQVSELDGIYLNFSDPWPKKRHAKRRLTHGTYLTAYKQVLKPDGFVEFKTDNDALYQFTLEEIQRMRMPLKEQTRDLHHSDYFSQCITTEYEDKFSGMGKNINYVKI